VVFDKSDANALALHNINLTCTVIQEIKRQHAAFAVMSQTRSRYWWAFQITAKITDRLQDIVCLFGKVHLPVPLVLAIEKVTPVSFLATK
jgi:hypothetical protein